MRYISRKICIYPNIFNVTDKEEIFVFIKDNTFGQLISLVEDKLFCSHIPFLLGDDNQSLICHVVKNNPQWNELGQQEVLVTFQGPHAYVSPSWYTSPGVPTWNYQSVHVYGIPQLITEKVQLSSLVNELTGIYESTLEKYWKPKYTESMLDAIIGIEIKITDIQCKYKLSQNRSESDRLEIIKEHKKRGSSQLSQATKKEL